MNHESSIFFKKERRSYILRDSSLLVFPSVKLMSFLFVLIFIACSLSSSLVMQSMHSFRTRLSFVVRQNFQNEDVDDEKDPMFSLSYDPLGNSLLPDNLRLLCFYF